MNRCSGSLFTVACLIGISGTAHAYSTTTLADAIAGTVTVQSGDKLFTNFNYTDLNGLLPDPSDIFIQYGNDVVDAKGNFGLRFTGSFVLAGPNLSDLATIGYQVNVVGSTNKITDADISVNAAVLPVASATAVDSLTEKITPTAGPAKTLVANVASEDAKVNLAIPVTQVTVTDTFQLSTGPSDLFAVDSIAEVYYSQTGGSVPEPGMAAMLAGIGAVGMLARRRRKA
jgi:hypothetical protein